MPAGGTDWHFGPRLHAQKRTERHSTASVSRLVDALARRRSEAVTHALVRIAQNDQPTIIRAFATCEMFGLCSRSESAT